MKRIALSVLLLAASLPGHAAQISKGEWVSGVETALPVAFCREKMYFRQCFSITATECEDTAASAARVCMDKYKAQIPDELNQPEDGSKWGRLVGGCAGNAFEVSLMNKRINSQECNNINNWK